MDWTATKLNVSKMSTGFLEFLLFLKDFQGAKDDVQAVLVWILASVAVDFQGPRPMGFS